MINTNLPLFVNKETGNIEEFFSGSVLDLTDIFINDLNVGILTTRKLNVGVGGTIITAGYGSSVGIGSTQPERRLDVNGSVKIKEFIYDSVNSPGVNGSFLNRDESGIRWVTFEPEFSEGVFIQDNGTYIPIVGAAQSFTVLNFKGINSLGIGTTTIKPIPNPTNPTLIADIQTQDFWGYDSIGSIYRMTNVGIGSTQPTDTLDIIGSLHVTDLVNFDSTLNVVGFTTLNSTLDVDGATVLETTLNVKGATDLDTTLNVDGATTLNSTLDVDGATTLNSTLDVDGATTLNSTLDVDGATVLQTTLNVKGATDLDTTLNVDGATVLQTTLNVKGATDLDTTLNVDGATTLNTTLDVDGATTLNTTLDVDGATTLNSTLDVDGATTLNSTLDVDGATTLNTTLDVDGATTLNSTLDVDGATVLQTTLNVKGATDLDTTLNVDGATTLNSTIELNSTLIDINGSVAAGKTDYRLSSVGTGVSWRPPGVQTQNALWVTLDGIDTNTGYLEGDAKRTIGAAASVAESGDTIFVRSGVYFENNPIGLRTDVSISGQDLRLVTIVPQNIDKDIFHVRRGCLIENLNFSGSNVSIAHTGCSAVAFPPIDPAKFAVSGFIASGPATEGPSGRWRSPYIRNCTNFITKSIGMKIDGNHATASSNAADLKSMVCDSFTQYNENGIGVSITNNGYAQLVSIFTINCDIGIYVDSGGNCDLTNSNSSFGNFGLVAVGLGSTEFTGIVSTFPSTRTEPGVDAGSDKVTFANMKDSLNNIRRPYDGQALFFKINLNNYPDAQGSGIILEPMVDIKSITVTNGGTGYSAATPPTVIIRDISDLSQQPKGPQGIIAEVSPTVDEISGAITAIDVVNSGRNYLSTQNLEVFIDGTGGATATVLTQPILFTIDSATPPSPVSGITTVTFNQFIPYALFGQEQVSLKRISRILTSSHSFEYIGTGTSINTSTPFQGGVPIKDNEIVALDGAQIPFTSTDQKGNFNIGEGLEINQPTSSIRGRDFSKAIQAEVTPLILALR